MSKDPNKLKQPPGLEKLRLPRIELKDSPAQRALFQQLGRENRELAKALRDAELRLAAGRRKPGRRSDKRDVILSILRELGPPATVTDYRLTQQIKPLWAKAWRRLKKSEPPEAPDQRTVHDARRYLQ